MLTQKKVAKSFKKVNKSLKKEGLRIEVVPDDSDLQILLDSKGSEEGTLLARVHNEDSKHPAPSFLQGTVYAFVQKQNLEMCNIPYEQREHIMTVLNDLTKNRVYQSGL